MIKPKLSKLVVVALVLLALYGCTTKNETPHPVVDQTSKTALQQQYNDLANQVLGAQSQATTDSLAAAMNETELQAAIAQFNLNLNTNVNYSVQVLTFPGHPLPAKVEVSQNGKIVSAPANAQGLASFSGLYAGRIIATVDYPGFARLVIRADIRNPYNSTTYSTTTSVRMMPLGGTATSDSAMTAKSFKLWANYSVQDDTLGGPDLAGDYFGGTSHAALALPIGPDSNNPNIKYDAVTTQPVNLFLTKMSFNNSYNGGWCGLPAGFTGWNNPGSMNGEVLSVVYENAIWTATAPDANGVYTMMIPANDDNGNNGEMRFIGSLGEFQHKFTQYVDGPWGSGPYVLNGKPYSDPLASTYRLYPTWDQVQIYRVDNTGGEYFYSTSQSTAPSFTNIFFRNYTN